jgi:1,4-alpha-glucan branching enzyme
VLDYDPAGFEWIDCKDVNNSIIIMMRRGRPDPSVSAAQTGALVSQSGDDGTSVADAALEATPPDEAHRDRQRQLDASRPFTIYACNFTPVVRHGYAVGMPAAGRYREILNSDDAQYGGSGVINEGVFETYHARVHERDQAILITLPPLGISVLELIRD